jgi:hypothetical protein
MNHIFSVLVILVLILVLVAAGLSYYQYYGAPQAPEVAAGAPGPEAAAPEGAPTSEEAAPPAGAEQPGGEEAAGGAPGEQPAGGKGMLLPMPPKEQRAETITQYALSSMPGWDSKVVSHDDEWKTATVRAVSPDGKISLDIYVAWDKELGDYAVTAAEAAGAAKATAAVPKGILDAIDANPKLKALIDKKVSVRRLTSNDATVLVQSEAGKFRVYLKQKGGHWSIVKARQL